MNFLKLIRYQNLLMLVTIQLACRYGFLELQNVPLALSDWQFIVLVVAMVCIAAGGAIINTICDVESNTYKNAPTNFIGDYISMTTAYNVYLLVTIIGVALGFYLSNVIGKPSFASIFIVIAATMYFYATTVKQILLVGNFIVALLWAVSILIIGVFDLYPFINGANRSLMRLLFDILLDYAFFTFLLILIQEVVKNLRNIENDLRQGIGTLPSILEKKLAVKIVLGLGSIVLILTIRYIFIYLFNSGLIFATIYGLVFVIAPLVYFTIQLAIAKNKNNFHHLHNILKAILFFGILSIAVISLNIKYNA